MNVSITQQNRITVVTLERPARRNAIDEATAAELEQAFVTFDRNPDSDVAVLTGAAGCFCAGADLKAVAQQQEVTVTEQGRGPLGPTRLLLSKPVIAAVEGYAVAGGLELALWCDLRVAAEDAVFGVYCRRWGVPLVDGGTVRLSRLIGHSHALDMLLTGRGVSGEEARQMGLANRLVPKGQTLATALELAERLSQFPQICLRNDRMASYLQWGHPIEDALQIEARYAMETISTGETHAGAERFAAGYGRHGSFDDV